MINRASKETRERAANHAAKTTATEACRIYKVGTQTMHRWMVEFGLDVPVRSLGEIYKIAVDEVLAGETAHAVALRHNLNQSNLKEKVDAHSAYTGIHPCVMVLGKVSGFEWHGVHAE